MTGLAAHKLAAFCQSGQEAETGKIARHRRRASCKLFNLILDSWPRTLFVAYNRHPTSFKNHFEG
jgi:hypothetical protein